MLSKAQISFITSLQQKKFRTQHGLFVVEGIKSVSEFVHSSYKVQKIISTADAWAKMDKIPQNIKYDEVTATDFNKISSLKSPQGILCLVEIPETVHLNIASLRGMHSIVLDDIQDPGNLGTIIRTAEWFGIKNIICSLETVDAYNPKVVQSTMGSLARVKIVYTDLSKFLKDTPLPVFGALLDGQGIYETNFGQEGLILMGNEGNGISEDILPHVQQAVTIPRIGNAESLNVAVATTIFCSEITRRKGNTSM